MKPIFSPLALSLFFWALLVGAVLALRPLMPMDETRYLAVAWEMWRDGNFLVPHLNGEAYSHKPPLLFWLMHLGWAVFGTGDVWAETWARLVSPLFALGTLVLTHRLALLLWPERTGRAAMALPLLAGTGFFAVYTTLTMFDVMVTFFTVMGLLGVAYAGRNQGGRALASGFGLLGLAIGLGVLAKGPAILLHLLPVTLLSPLWLDTRQGRSWGQWYGATGGALLLGVGIALSWAIPAGIAGGPEYRDAIFWGQSAGRVTESFAHARPVWWYGAWLPAVLLPWVLWPTLWRAAWANTQKILPEPGVRFLLIWFAVAFAVFSVISGKQFHYLLPELPALALIAARLLDRKEETQPDGGTKDLMIPGILVFLFGVAAMVFLRPGVVSTRIPDAIEAEWMAPAVIVGAGLLLLAFQGGRGRLTCCMVGKAWLLAIASLTLIVSVHLSARAELARAYDTTPLGHHLAALEQANTPVAVVGKYAGQYHFRGRIKGPFTVLDPNQDAARDWARAHPNGIILSHREDPPAPEELTRAQAQAWPFRGKTAVLWPSQAIIVAPELLSPQ